MSFTFLANARLATFRAQYFRCAAHTLHSYRDRYGEREREQTIANQTKPNKQQQESEKGADCHCIKIGCDPNQNGIEKLNRTNQNRIGFRFAESVFTRMVFGFTGS